MTATSPKTLFRHFEGGSVYTVEEDGKFLVISDESAMADLLDEEDLEDMELIKVLEFTTELERSNYLDQRYNKAK